jgi:hypothetical protein
MVWYFASFRFPQNDGTTYCGKLISVFSVVLSQYHLRTAETKETTTFQNISNNESMKQIISLFI